jgi:hypothetical protein
MTARRDGKRLTVTLGEGIRPGTAMRVFWPDRVKPVKVTVDGRVLSAYDADGIRLDKPFHTLTADY